MVTMRVTASAASRYYVVSERGPGNFVVDTFEAEADARLKAAKYYACHCVFHQTADGSLTELEAGGYGLAWTFRGIRRYAHSQLDTNAVRFANRRDRPIVNPTVAPERRITLGIVYPMELQLQGVFMSFDSQKPVHALVTAALSHANVTLDKGKLPGSPERVNLFTLEGDVVRADLEVEAHIGSTLHAGDCLVLERGNNLSPSRINAVRRALE
jgi:hypothetical protein